MNGPRIADALVALATPPRPAAFLLDDDEAARHADVRLVLAAVADALAEIGRGAVGRRWVDIAALGPASRSLLSSMLSVGEISATVATDPPVRILETALAGVWMVDGAKQGLDVGDLPDAVRQAGTAGSHPLVLPERPPEGAMNVLPVLAEIRHHVDSGTAEHEINLTLLPMTETDHAVLDAALGTGPVEILSRGYGACRIRSAAVGGVWRTRYYNSDGRMILNVVQIGQAPVAARAAAEDMADSLIRLRELTAAYFPR